jgi:DNA (cytosine-5)-methyltransferase 1
METGKPWVIENVMGAKPELLSPFMLCGRMFYLTATDTDGTHLVLDRHRLFETSPGLTINPPVHYKHDTSVQVAGVYGGARRDKVEARTVRKGGYVPADTGVLKTLIGAEWMTIQGLFLSIPPAYTFYIAQELTNQGFGSSLKS